MATHADNNGLVTIESSVSVQETIERLTTAIAAAGLMVFARIDHADNAIQAGLDLRPTELLIFGHPRAGTLLMQDHQTSGIELPVKALAWQDEDGRVWLTYNDASWLATRHNLGERSHATIESITAGLAAMAQHATRGR